MAKYRSSRRKYRSQDGQIPEFMPQIPESNSGISEPNSGISEDDQPVATEPELDVYGLTVEAKQQLMNIADEVRSSKKVSKQTVRSTIILLCENEYRTPKLLEELLGRTAVRRNYLTNMVIKGELERKYPQVLNSPDQAYKSSLYAVATLKSNGADLSLFPE